MLLGTVAYPAEWDPILRSQRSVRFMAEPLRIRALDFFESPDESPTYRFGTLYESYCEQGAVGLDGVSVEEFERLPGCSFSPSLAYIRNLLLPPRP